ncbi:MAG: radical SAM protein [Myxococcota bacterium]
MSSSSSSTRSRSRVTWRSHTPSLRRLLHPLYRSLETSVHPLRYLFVEITQRCNLACRHCGSDCTSATHPRELSTDEWLAFFSYLGRHFDPRQLVLVVTGGEPLCAPAFESLQRGLRDNGLRWGMVTNGYALSERRLQHAMAHGLVSVTISLDGLAAAHDWLRGVVGSHERAVDAIGRVAQSSLPFFDVVTCVNPRNLGELDAIDALLTSLRVPAWRLFSIFPKGRAKDAGELALSDAELAKLLAWIRARRECANAHGPRVQFSCEGYVPPPLDAAIRDEPYFCRAGISIGSVLCDGAISACPNITRALVQGNIRNDDFKTVWDERFGALRDRSWMRRGACESCGDWRRCQGNSLHLWDEEAQATGRCFRPQPG